MTFVAGLLVGALLGVFIMAILCASKRSDQLDYATDDGCDCAQERKDAWQDGYAKGCDEAFELAHAEPTGEVEVRFDDTDNEHTQVFSLASALN